MSDHTLRPSIEQALSTKKWSLVKLAEETGINRSVFSNTLRAKAPTPISFSLLEKITLAIGHGEGYFFEAYINECFLGGKSNKSRVRPFLIRCGELGKARYIERVLEQLETEKEERHLELIFEIAEELTRSGSDAGALPFYYWIAKLDKSMYSERVTVSQYRIFILSIGKDEERNFQALLTFTPLLKYLPIVLKIQALHTIINLNDILSRHEENLLMVDEQIKLCLEFFGTKDNPVLNPDTKGYTFFRPEVAYYGQAYLMKQHCLFETGEFEASLRYGYDYEDLTWFPNLDEKGWYEVKKFRMFAIANNIHIRLMLGRLEALDELPDFLRQHPREILPCMITVLDAANEQNFSVDSFIKEFTLSLQDYMTIEGNTYTLQASRNRYVLLLQKLSTYHYNRGRHEEALQAAIQSWELSKTTNNHSHLRMLASLAVMYNTASAE